MRWEGPPCAPLAFLLCQHLPCRLPDTCSCGPCIIQNVFIFQMYLRSWAKELSVPILSIDYSLAPEAPFPRALEECFFVYAWCLNNFHHLGTNGKRVCVAGDSAGSAFFQSLASQGSQSNICSFFSTLASANLMLLASVLQRAIVNCEHFPLMILWHLSTRVVATMFNIAKKVMARVVTKISSC